MDAGRLHRRAGTSLEAFQLTQFARSSREALRVRVISVERNGFGESPLDTALGYADDNAEVLAVLDQLGVEELAITVQYRHWHQTLADIAGFGDHTVICHRDRTRLVPEARAQLLLARGATLGLCAWAG